MPLALKGFYCVIVEWPLATHLDRAVLHVPNIEFVRLLISFVPIQVHCLSFSTTLHDQGKRKRHSFIINLKGSFSVYLLQASIITIINFNQSRSLRSKHKLIIDMIDGLNRTYLESLQYNFGM